MLYYLANNDFKIMWEKAAINSNSREKIVIQNRSACLFSTKFDIIEYIKKTL